MCHGYRRRGFARCTGCERVLSQVRSPCPLVVPISLAGTDPPSGLYRLLCNYKDGRRGAADRAALAAVLARLIDSFLAVHGKCIATGPAAGWDSVAVVPSTGTTGATPSAGTRAASPAGTASRARPPGPHPLQQVVACSEALAGLAILALERGEGPLGHLLASDEGFCCREAEGRRVLLLDDTYTSGARCQSAASALVAAGASVAAVLVIARLVRPAFRSGRPYWSRQRSSPFELARCCLEARALPPAGGGAVAGR